MSCTRALPQRSLLPPRRVVPLVLLLLTGFVMAPQIAHAGPSEEGERQLVFAEAELHKGEFTKALHSAESALRLDPTLYRAMVVKGLAYEGLGDLDLAESLLRAYCELAGRNPAEGEVGRALARIEARQEVARTQERRSSSGRSGDEMPTLEGLRQRRERIHVYREERAHSRARDELALLAGEHVAVWRTERESEALFLGGWALAELGEDEQAERALQTYLDKAGDTGRLSIQAATILARLRGEEPPGPADERSPEPAPVAAEIPVVTTTPRATEPARATVAAPKPGPLLLGAGLGAALAGGVIVMATGIPYEAGRADQDWPDWYRDTDWSTTRATNTVGWSVLVIGGGVAAAGGVVLAVEARSGAVSIAPVPGGVLVRGVFP